MSIQHVLVIGYVWPEPNSSAAGQHMMSLLTLFTEQGWTVSFASPAVQGEHKIDLTEMGISEHSIALNCSSFDDFIVQQAPDLVLFDRFMLEEQFGWRVAKHCPDALRVLDTEDLHSLRDARHRALKQGRSVNECDLKSDLALREIASIYRCDISLIISDYEHALLQETFDVPKYLLHHCPFMLDLNSAGEQTANKTFSQRQDFISIGNFRHEPNWNAVLWLKSEIWPLIRQALPAAQLHIYGAYPPPKATQLHKPNQGFHIKGWAEDAKAVMSDARVCLAPLRFGAGIKGKLAEAMLCQTPSVTTSIGIEGMCGDNHWPGAVANTAQEIAQHAIALYQDEVTWRGALQNTKQVLQRFNKSTLGPELVAHLTETKRALSAHRLKNFTGSMLQHHHHKSTQYMAQWIEAKNRPEGGSAHLAK
ncbi:glycosyltransferase [Paraglaciecola chathamensis]|uniref:Glycosyltransferase n=1 Tax=Paraglaciecola chathamensis TaxID=368405 RepID=A0ABS0WEI8_9ALTE|nr:glycosyltransferase [Paraglaciecola chathamensis]MBJ2136862.1 glycosyltransferase [Paraglaciecola chathamensis]